MNNLEGYIEAVFNFDKNQDPAGYEERSGQPQELPAVIGLISLSFQLLEDELANRIIQMLELEQEIGEIITSELSFKNLLNLFSSLHHKLKNDFHFNSLKNHEEGYFKELLKALSKCEEMRNQIFHSTITQNFQTKKIVRKKTTSKAKFGLKRTEHDVDIPYLYNISDYIVSMTMELDQFFINFKRKTSRNE